MEILHMNYEAVFAALSGKVSVPPPSSKLTGHLPGYKIQSRILYGEEQVP